jgi:predicted metal-dependent hydrolase
VEAATQIDMFESLFCESAAGPKQEHTIIDGYSVPYFVLRKNIRNARLEFKLDKLLLVLPPKTDSNELIENHRKWILQKYREIQDILSAADKFPLTLDLDRAGLLEKSEHIISTYEKELRVRSKDVQIRKMTATWGSLNPKGIITVSSLARFLPDKLLHYILYHEVLHLKRANHGKIFQRYITRKYPDKKAIEKTLYAYWLIIRKRAL